MDPVQKEFENDLNNNEEKPEIVRHTLQRFLSALGISFAAMRNYFDPLRLLRAVPKPSWTDYSLTDFEIGKPLGEGKYGHVYLARTVRSQFIVALKVIHVEQILEDKMEAQINRETSIHAQLSHPNILHMYGCFMDGDKIAYVMEFAPGGDVFQQLLDQPGNRFTNERAALYIRHVISALSYLHSKKIIHRDIKPENILIGYYGDLKLADFGWAIKVNRRTDRRKTVCGTMEYMPPEVLLRRGYNEMADVWCLGTLAYEFLVGGTPFPRFSLSDTSDSLRRTMGFQLPDFINANAADFIRKLLVREPEMRMNLSMARKHEWLRESLPDSNALIPRFDQFNNVDTEALGNIYESMSAKVVRESYKSSNSV